MTGAPIGAHVDGDTGSFAVFSSVADAIDLCLFDEHGRETRQQLEPDDASIWRGRAQGVGHGTRYGFRVHGPWDPQRGLRCNPANLLLDPYARAIAGGVRWDNALDSGTAVDSAPYVPRSVVCARQFEWGDDRRLETPLENSIFYELHVKGFTQRHPEVPRELRGTYRGLVEPPVLDHLHRLGVTAVELLPVHQFVHDAALVARGLRNFWGYQSIGYFAPHNAYASNGDGGGQVDDFKAMVIGLHDAGLEVILDVVFNHTAEGNENGPTLCFRGLDNGAYYRLRLEDPRRYEDDTGTGNTFDAHQPQALRLIMDSLRYWVQEMHVDGFRFDLAAALGRGSTAFDPHSAFLDAVGQDPVLAQVKLIAEPWDIGYGGYELGNFPPGWSEWNGRYRDTVRDFWRGVDGTLPDFATRLTGSSDLYGRGRRPTASINLVTVHDGFTMMDLVSFNAKHNEANGEGNRDGTDDNNSWNCGVEGATEDQEVVALRRRQRRNLLATMLLSEGVPLLLAGDEHGRTQRGNNNAYCQDNDVSWVDWSLADEADDLTEFVAALCRLRLATPMLHSRRFFADRDLRWLRPDGEVMTEADWANRFARAVAVTASDGVILMLNGWWEPLSFRLPRELAGVPLSVLVDTSVDGAMTRAITGAGDLILPARSLMLVGRDDDRAAATVAESHG